ncbi:MAG: nucleoside phosphorylase [Alphaproteobacteria bacterium]|nr:nucleoside phosphorylase [Alphaproteobacteria bacterium]
MTRLGFVTGLRREAAILEAASRGLPEEARPLICCGGAHTERAGTGALRLVEAGAGALISFGIAGGLAPSLASGSLVLASAVQVPGKASFDVEPAWRERLCRRLSAAMTPQLGEVVGSHRVVQSVDDKARLYGETLGLAVDMESHAVAQVARERALPFLVVRAVADTASMPIPSPALHGVGPRGEMRPFAVLGRAVFAPSEWPALLRLSGAHQKALGALRDVVRIAGIDLAFEQRN